MKDKLSTPGTVAFVGAIAGGVALAIWGGAEYAGHAQAFFGLAVGFATRLGMVGKVGR